MAYADPAAGKRRETYSTSAVANVSSANAGAEYTSAEQALINELKTKLNALLAECRKAGVISS
jgi:hypothetical protein